MTDDLDDLKVGDFVRILRPNKSYKNLEGSIAQIIDKSATPNMAGQTIFKIKPLVGEHFTSEYGDKRNFLRWNESRLEKI